MRILPTDKISTGIIVNHLLPKKIYLPVSGPGRRCSFQIFLAANWEIDQYKTGGV